MHQDTCEAFALARSFLFIEQDSIELTSNPSNDHRAVLNKNMDRLREINTVQQMNTVTQADNVQHAKNGQQTEIVQPTKTTEQVSELEEHQTVEQMLQRQYREIQDRLESIETLLSLVMAEQKAQNSARPVARPRSRAQVLSCAGQIAAKLAHVLVKEVSDSPTGMPVVSVKTIFAYRPAAFQRLRRIAENVDAESWLKPKSMRE